LGRNVCVFLYSSFRLAPPDDYIHSIVPDCATQEDAVVHCAKGCKTSIPLAEKSIASGPGLMYLSFGSLRTGSRRGRKKISASAKQKNSESKAIGAGTGSFRTDSLPSGSPGACSQARVVESARG